MPEDKNMAVDSELPQKNKSTTNIRSSGNALAQVTMLDGTVLDINIDVRLIILWKSARNVYIFFFFAAKSQRERIIGQSVWLH